jgi:thiol-disulfide isomerase/thioredoxin
MITIINANNMKYFFLLLLSFISIIQLSGQKRNRSFSLTGKIEGFDSGYVYLYYQKNDSIVVTDSCQVKNHQVNFQDMLAEPILATLSTFNPDNNFYDENNITRFYIEPGSKMNFSGKYSSLKELKLTGSNVDNDRQRLVEKEKPIIDKIKLLSDTDRAYTREYVKKKSAGASKYDLDNILKKQDSLRQISRGVYMKIREIDSAFIVDNPKSIVTLYMLYDNIRSASPIKFNSLEVLYNRLPTQLQNYKIGKAIKNRVEQENFSKSGNAINFTAIDIKGDTVDFSSFKSKKYVLLDFGASWCVPCRQLVPYLKKIYAEYQNKNLEIIDISIDKNKADWVKSVQEDSTTWINILEKEIFPTKTTSKPISDRYYVSTIPVLLLVDKNFKIIGNYVGYGNFNKLEEKLKEIFKN